MEELCRFIAIRMQDRWRIFLRFAIADYLPAFRSSVGVSILLSFLFWFIFQVTRVIKVSGTSIVAVVIFACEFIRLQLRDGPSEKSWGGRRTLGDHSVCVRPFFIFSKTCPRTPALWHLPRITRQLYSGVKFVMHLFDIWATYRSARVLKKVNAMTILKPAC
jgi:hypothetical protein